MKIFLLLNQPYPHGFALTKRFHLYAKGFVHEGHIAKVILPVPTEANNVLNNSKISGIFEKIPFEYTCNNTIRSKRFILRRWQDILGSIKAGLVCIRELPDVLIISAFPIYFYLFLKVISIVTGTKLIREKNEVDFLDENEISEKQIKQINRKNRLFHGFIVINSQLQDYLRNDLKLKTKSLVVPILIQDFKADKHLSTTRNITYTGTYLERKDGILTILKAFSKLIQKNPDLNLVLTGSPQRSKDYHALKTIIENHNLERNICFPGYLLETELQDILMSSSMLILAKPENRQNRYNFPTKIGEYLISGRPVISTKTGIIGDILKDRENVVFTEFSAENICQNIEYILNHPKEANTIGSNGRKFALENFDYHTHTQRMIRFFKMIQSCK
ncbi:Glycosyltransferase involved in cell wall bisynthesis [Draconibacterium orientale]|uniref:Glycosyltransferase involved in cell wall bisynthesis n=1 Tax=Draconibacterium orientale TaxID=1168034 RepID=X5E6K9_9BACT|nr:glycosyltransferase family 4 protein [Draconibacterium orientale]AHW62271.1 hypothetical protein FH5T_18655 [Draconibacterium orientale]SET86654.1 Glycosyltransferase involved in cell wall bisynthesis [Draconibacterium orientale]